MYVYIIAKHFVHVNDVADWSYDYMHSPNFLFLRFSWQS